MWQHDKRYCDVGWTTIVSNAMLLMKHKWCTIRQPLTLKLSRFQRKFGNVHSRIAFMNEWEQICLREAAFAVHELKINYEGRRETNSTFPLMRMTLYTSLSISASHLFLMNSFFLLKSRINLLLAHETLLPIDINLHNEVYNSDVLMHSDIRSSKMFMIFFRNFLP